MFPARNLGLLSHGLKQKWYTGCMHNNVYAQIHTHTFPQAGKTHISSANTHNRKSVNEWEGAGRLAGAVLVEDMASVHLSISKHSQLSSFSTGGEVIPFFLFSSASPSSLLSPFLPSPSAPAFSPVSFIHSPPPLLYTSPSLAFIFYFSSQHSPAFPFSTPPFSLAIPSFLLCSSSSPALSAEQPIQQQNKAAYSITHWLIKQDQNSAALRSTQQHHDTGLHWRGAVSHIRTGDGGEEEM